MSLEEEAQAQQEFRKCISNFTKLAAMKCAVELGIPDVLEKRTMTLMELSSTVGCQPSYLYRIMRLLTHHHIFKEVKFDEQDSPISYTQTPISRLLMKNNRASSLLLTCSPENYATMMSLSKFLVSKDSATSCFEMVHGVNVWRYMESNPSFNKLFNDAMACNGTFVISTVIQNYPKAFEGITSLVDVGGGNGTTLRALVKACPWIIRAVNFDLPHVVHSLINEGHVEHVGGDMFETIPTADSALLMAVLHDWDDEACGKILKNCKRAISKEIGKVIIVEVVISDDNNLNENNNTYKKINLELDVVMMTQSIKGKERTQKEWEDILNASGFTKYSINHISGPKSVIEAYP